MLRPGGRILLVVQVRSWRGVPALHLSLRLGSRNDWRLAAQSAGLEIVDEGRFNASAFLLLEKPRDLQVQPPRLGQILRPTIVQIVDHIGVHMSGWLSTEMRMIRRKLRMFVRQNIGIRCRPQALRDQHAREGQHSEHQ